MFFLVLRSRLRCQQGSDEDGGGASGEGGEDVGMVLDDEEAADITAVAVPVPGAAGAGEGGEMQVVVEDRYNPLLYGCRSVEHYERMGMIAQVCVRFGCVWIGRAFACLAV